MIFRIVLVAACIDPVMDTRKHVKDAVVSSALRVGIIPRLCIMENLQGCQKRAIWSVCDHAQDLGGLTVPVEISGGL